MDGKSTFRQPLSLAPIESSSPAGDAARPTSDESSSEEKAKRDLRIRTADEFLARAAKEYQEGEVDQALWRRAADQGGNDVSLVIAAYLRARATALQLQQKQSEPSPRLARGTGRARAGAGPIGEWGPEAETDSDGEAGARSRRMHPQLMYSAAGVASLAAVVAVVWLITSPRGSESVQQPAVSAAVPASNRPAAPLPAGAGHAVAAAQGDLRPDFAARVQELKQAGNWNVLVLYASDWARKEPNNASAWHELSVGYAKIRQLDDAFHAAAKAVELSPEDALLWNTLGQVNLSLERLPEAKVAFDRALALRPDDADTLCGAALVARKEGRSGDAEALAARVKNAAGGCGVSTAVAVKR
jgi:tetratricopeptide (TPR) repeat protein